MSTLQPDYVHRAPAENDSPVYRALLRLAGLIDVWAERSLQRRHMRRLLRGNPLFLKDIGVRRYVIWQEISKPFWRV